MWAPLHLAGPHREARLASIEHLNLGFLIDAEHERLVGRRQVQTYDIADFLDEQRILRRKDSARCGCSPNAPQTRRIVV